MAVRYYYFDVKDGIYVLDDEGRDFRDDQEALQHARKVADELGSNRREKADLELIVRDEYQNTLFKVRGAGVFLAANRDPHPRQQRAPGLVHRPRGFSYSECHLIYLRRPWRGAAWR